jgi:hypothetical protein
LFRFTVLATTIAARVAWELLKFIFPGGVNRSSLSYSVGSLKFAHHFGLNRAATFGEQLILHDCVTHSISSPVLSVAPGGAAAPAAGDKLLSGVVCCGTTSVVGAAGLIGSC